MILNPEHAMLVHFVTQLQTMIPAHAAEHMVRAQVGSCGLTAQISGSLLSSCCCVQHSTAVLALVCHYLKQTGAFDRALFNQLFELAEASHRLGGIMQPKGDA